MDRPAFKRLMEDVKTGKVKTIVVWRLDRLGRTAGGLTVPFDELNALKVNLVSLKDGLDLSTPAGTLMANVLASVAQYETEVRADASMPVWPLPKPMASIWAGNPVRTVRASGSK